MIFWELQSIFRKRRPAHNAAIENCFPRSIILFFPDREILAKGDRFVFGTIGTKLPWTSRVSEIPCKRDIGEHRFPTQQPLPRLSGGPILLAVYGGRLKHYAIIGQKFEE